MTTPYESNTRESQHRGIPSAQEQSNALQGKAKQVAENAKMQGKSQIDRYSDQAANEIETVANSIKAAASELNDNDRAGLSGYVSNLAQSMVGLADTLRGKSADELIREASRLARENPALFLTGSVAIGFGLSRFAKASSRSSSSVSSDSEMPTSSNMSTSPSMTERDSAESGSMGGSGTTRKAEGMGTSSGLDHTGMASFDSSGTAPSGSSGVGASTTSSTSGMAGQTSTPIVAEVESTYEKTTTVIPEGDTKPMSSVVRPASTSDLADTPAYGSSALDKDKNASSNLGGSKKDTTGGF
ncbi:hypothetical protein IQ22_03654 [Pseudomonas duriflava]|uniref:Uncharacterized protein n=1 Tax=Pseudomonas duriflava TaxID=459528 RepID=A0A562Q2P3_9PSED|nr:hypothetical protein [Pseudomonas duriflava]TWI50955.1 hypothetical protein IQ22_03654 [Pseudomonas duriflava]